MDVREERASLTPKNHTWSPSSPLFKVKFGSESLQRPASVRSANNRVLEPRPSQARLQMGLAMNVSVSRDSPLAVDVKNVILGARPDAQVVQKSKELGTMVCAVISHVEKCLP